MEFSRSDMSGEDGGLLELSESEQEEEETERMERRMLSSRLLCYVVPGMTWRDEESITGMLLYRT